MAVVVDSGEETIDDTVGGGAATLELPLLPGPGAYVASCWLIESSDDINHVRLQSVHNPDGYTGTPLICVETEAVDRTNSVLVQTDPVWFSPGDHWTVGGASGVFLLNVLLVPSGSVTVGWEIVRVA